jgi:hypothetical protein
MWELRKMKTTPRLRAALEIIVFASVLGVVAALTGCDGTSAKTSSTGMAGNNVVMDADVTQTLDGSAGKTMNMVGVTGTDTAGTAGTTNMSTGTAGMIGTAGTTNMATGMAGMTGTAGETSSTNDAGTVISDGSSKDAYVSDGNHSNTDGEVNDDTNPIQPPVYTVTPDPMCEGKANGTACEGGLCNNQGCCRGCITNQGACMSARNDRACGGGVSNDYMCWNCWDLTGQVNATCSSNSNKCSKPVLSTPAHTISELDTGPFAGNTTLNLPVGTDASCLGIPEGSPCMGALPNQFGFSGNSADGLVTYGRCSHGTCCTGCFDSNGLCVEPYAAQASSLQTPTCGIGGGRCVVCTSTGQACVERPPTDATLHPSMNCENI